jgi:hypothetical protein
MTESDHSKGGDAANVQEQGGAGGIGHVRELRPGRSGPPAEAVDLEADVFAQRRQRRERRAKLEQKQARLVLATIIVFALALFLHHYAFAFEAILAGFVWYLWLGRKKRRP